MVDREEGVDLARRRILTGVLAASAACCLPVCASDFWSQPRHLRVVRPKTGESLNAVYWRNGAIDVAGYTAICGILRDVRANQVVQINTRLLDLLCAIQAWVGAYGYNAPIEILSGYRSPYTNAHTEGAARNSMHMYGRAADIVLPGLPVEYLGRLAQRYSAGGVGFYQGSGFIHVDTGRIRTWRK